MGMYMNISKIKKVQHKTALFCKKNWKIILGVFFLLILINAIAAKFTKEEEINNIKIPTVSTYTIGGSLDEPLKALCSIESVESPSIQAETSGQIKSVMVQENDVVRAGQTLFVLENIDESIAVEDAKADVARSRASLNDLLKNTTASGGGKLEVVKNQQDAAVVAARSALFNNDLRAYPEDDNGSGSLGGAPLVSGSYRCENEGQYDVRVYASSGGSAYDFDGLESGIATASTEFPVAIGSCGIRLTLAGDASNGRDWVIPIPNTRSATYSSALNAYNSALANKSVALDQAQVTPEQIDQARQQLRQSELRQQSAQNRLAKTYITAPISGVFVEGDFNKGDFVSTAQVMGSVRSADQLQAVTYITEDEVAYVDKDTVATIVNQVGIINNIGSILIGSGKKIKVEILLMENTTLTEGDTVQCTLKRSLPTNGEIAVGDTVATPLENKILTIPLSALSVIGIDTFVFIVNEENILVKLPVQTGALLGKQVTVISGLERSQSIVADARGLQEGQEVIIN